ncbi:MAG: acyl-CoA dehydrogenase family protein [Microthrixaceae bacterium]
MDLLPSEEQDEITNTVRAQLESDFAMSDLAARDRTDQVIDDALWQRCAELGWFALGIPEASGGVGYGLVEEALLFEQLGRHATPGPFLATVLAAHVAAATGADEVLGGILAGTTRVALAEAEPPPPGEPEVVPGTIRVRVTDYGGADVLAYLNGSTSTLLEAAMVEPSVEAPLDPLVPLASALIEPAGGAAITTLDSSSLALRATVLLSAQLAGIAKATTEQSVEYVKDREQFGRPVGSFQAVKHRCADMAVRADAALQLTRLAALAVEGGHDDAGFQAEAARVVANDAAVTNAEINVQNHGGIGFTYEHTAHRYVTRSRVLACTAGTRTDHLAKLLGASSDR